MQKSIRSCLLLKGSEQINVIVYESENKGNVLGFYWKEGTVSGNGSI